MNRFPYDYIAIDTNIFEHLFNPAENTGKHINKILYFLKEKGTKLLVDSDGCDSSRICDEYGNRLESVISNRSDTGTNEIFLLEYWLFIASKEKVCLNNNDKLMIAIMKVMGNSHATDRIFVYVAFKKGRILLTNDKQDIIDEGNQKDVRRDKLLKQTKQSRRKIRTRNKDKSNILTSLEAEKHI